MRSTVTDRSFAPSTLGVRGVDTNAGNRLPGEAIRKVIHPYGAGRGGPMELQCPNCKSTDLKKVSLAYQEGLQHVSTRTRLRGVVVGSDGPDVVVGRATTKGTQQTEISKALTPPTKWSYAKALWLVGLGVLIGRLDSVLCEHHHEEFFICFFASFDDLCCALRWRFCGAASLPIGITTTLPIRDNSGVWDRSFICQRCGAIVEQP